MLTDTQEGRILINEVAYRIVADNAPEERPLYVGIRDKYFADPQGFSKVGETADEPLGIGDIIVLETLTQVVFPIIASILGYLTVEVAKALTGKASEELAKEAVQWIRSLFSQPDKKPLFNQEELEAIAKTIQEIAQTEAAIHGLELAKAKTVSDSVIARLALAKK